MSPSPSPPPPRRAPRLRRRIRAHAAQVLALPSTVLQVSVRVRMKDRYHEVAIVLGPPGAGGQVPGAAGPAAGYPGEHLGPFERQIWDALASGPLLGKQIAAALGVRNDQRLKYTLAGLRARHVLRKAKAGGLERNR